MEKQVLSIEQMQHLQKLGVDTSKASMCYMLLNDDENTELWVHNQDCYDFDFLKPIPTFTLSDILDLLPEEINDYDWFFLYIDYQCDRIFYGIDTSCDGLIIYKEIKIEKNKSLIDAAYEMLCWIIENRFLTNKTKQYE